MTEQEALAVMIAPGQVRQSKWRGGVIQIIVTRACNLSCFNCTQGSNLGGKTGFMTPDQFKQSVLSLRGYTGVYGTFGGNPSLSPYFGEYCEILREHVPFNQRGLWCNHPKGWGKEMRKTFDPSISNLNVHLDREAYEEFKRDWPESHPFGLGVDSRHSPCFVAIRDVIDDESKRWELISGCDINRFWSAAIGVFRGEVRAWFCEIAGAQAMLHQHEPDYPDTGIPIGSDGQVTGMVKLDMAGMPWWQWSMYHFTSQVRKHCHDCGVPLRGHGELAQAPDDRGKEQISLVHLGVYKPKRKNRTVETVTSVGQLGKPLRKMTAYVENSKL